MKFLQCEICTYRFLTSRTIDFHVMFHQVICKCQTGNFQITPTFFTRAGNMGRTVQVIQMISNVDIRFQIITTWAI